MLKFPAISLEARAGNSVRLTEGKERLVGSSSVTGQSPVITESLVVFLSFSEA